MFNNIFSEFNSRKLYSNFYILKLLFKGRNGNNIFSFYYIDKIVLFKSILFNFFSIYFSIHVECIKIWCKGTISCWDYTSSSFRNATLNGSWKDRSLKIRKNCWNTRHPDISDSPAKLQEEKKKIIWWWFDFESFDFRCHRSSCLSGTVDSSWLRKRLIWRYC